MGCSVPTAISTSRFLNLRLRKHYRKGGGKTARARGPGNLLRDCIAFK